MRVNVYTEELLKGEDNLPFAEIVKTEYISSRTHKPMKNYGLRVFVKSHPDLHYIPGRDDDRSAVTFWCGSKERNVFMFLDAIKAAAGLSSLEHWHNRVANEQTAAEMAEAERGANVMEPSQ